MAAAVAVVGLLLRRKHGRSKNLEEHARLGPAAVEARVHTGLPAIDSMNVNSKVNAAPGFQVQEQTMNDRAGVSVEILMRQNGADVGRLVSIEGASPGALQTAEASRKTDETDAIYAVRGGSSSTSRCPAVRAKDLLPSLCGAGMPRA